MPSHRYEQNHRSDISLFLRLLHPAAFPTDINLNNKQLVELWFLALKHNIAMLFYSRLQSQKEQLPAEVSTFLAEKLSAFLASVARSARQEAEEQRLLSILREKGIAACVIKGSETARQIYGDPNSRSSSDIDLLVRQCDIHEVDRLLVEEGYARYDNAPLRFWLQRIHHAAYCNKISGHTVEAHWSFGIPAFFDLSSEEIWAAAEIRETGRIALLPEMQVIQALTHHHMHSFQELRSLVDLLWIFHAYADVIDWQHFAARLQKIGLIKTAQITLHQLTALWGESAGRMRAVKELEEAFTAMDCRVSKMLCAYFRPPDLNLPHNRSTSEMQVLKRHPLLDKLMMRYSLDRYSTIWHSVLKSFIPSPMIIKALYNDRRKWMLPVLYIRFLEWRLKEWLR